MLEQEFTHNLDIEQLQFYLNDPESLEQSREPNYPDLDYRLGYTVPIIQIRDNEIAAGNIRRIEIDSYTKIPTISLSLNFEIKHPVANMILKDREILKTFMRSSNPNKNHIRTDFYITDINNNRRGDHVSMLLTGEINIPRLHTSVNTAYRGTSLDVMRQIAKDLDLGFITNISSTDDEMVWLSTNQSYLEFIDYVAKHGWIDDTSFVDWYIDSMYNLVYYEVNKTLKENIVDTRAYFVGVSSNKYREDKPESEKSMEWKNIFTDLGNMNTTDHGVQVGSLKLINNSGLSRQGYFVDNILLDYSDLDTVRFSSEAITNINEGVPLKGNENNLLYKDERRVKFLGIQNDNMHPNYKYAVIHNHINNIELRKLNVEFDSTDLNMGYIVGDNILLNITETRLTGDDAKSFTDRQDEQIQEPDVYFSNNYKVHGIKYIYKNEQKYCKYLLTRREWPVIID